MILILNLITIIIAFIHIMIRLRRKDNSRLSCLTDVGYYMILSILCLVITLISIYEKDILATLIWGFNFYQHHRFYSKNKERLNQISK